MGVEKGTLITLLKSEGINNLEGESEGEKTELRERGRIRAAKWSEPRMASRKKDKDKGDEKEKPDWVDLLEKRLVDALENQYELILKRMADMEGKMDSKIEGLKIEVNKSVERLKAIEQKLWRLRVT